MKKYITIIAAIAALVAISCTREELTPEEGRSLPEFTVCVSRGDCTRSTLDSETGGKFLIHVRPDHQDYRQSLGQVELDLPADVHFGL